MLWDLFTLYNGIKFCFGITTLIELYINKQNKVSYKLIKNLSTVAED